MTAKEWRNHTDERIAALFAGLEQTKKLIDDLAISTNRQIKENADKTNEQINMLLAAQIQAAERTNQLEAKIEQVIDKVDSWLESLQSHNGKQ
jgi:hypothetical protein